MKSKFIYLIIFLLPTVLLAQPEKMPPAKIFQQGMQQFNNQQYDAAIQSFTKFINIKPNPDQKPQQAAPPPGKKAEAFYFIGMSYLKKGNSNDQAIANLAKALELRPDYPQAKLARGKIYVEQKKYDLAVGDLSAVTQAMPGNEEAHFQLGLAYAWQANYPQTIQALKRTLEINGQNAYAHYWIGLAYSKTNETGRAEEHWRQFVQLCPNCPETPQVTAFLNRR